MQHLQYPCNPRVPLNQMQQENRHPNILGQHQPCYIRKRMPMNSHSSHMQNQQVRTNVLYPNNPAKTNWHYPNHPVRPNGKTFYQRTPSQQQGYPQQRMYSGQQVHSTRSRNFR